MRRSFQKGLNCLHALLSCECAPEPMEMRLQTVNKPDLGLVILCATYTAHGRDAMRRKFSYVNDALERKVQRALGESMRKDDAARVIRSGLLHQSYFTIHPDGRVADRANKTVGFISKL